MDVNVFGMLPYNFVALIADVRQPQPHRASELRSLADVPVLDAVSRSKERIVSHSMQPHDMISRIFNIA